MLLSPLSAHLQSSVSWCSPVKRSGRHQETLLDLYQTREDLLTLWLVWWITSHHLISVWNWSDSSVVTLWPPLSDFQSVAEKGRLIPHGININTPHLKPLRQPPLQIFSSLPCNYRIIDLGLSSECWVLGLVWPNGDVLQTALIWRVHAGS